MILLVGCIVIALIIGGLVGYLIGSHGSKAIDSSIKDVKDKVDLVHTKAESIKDDLIVIENIVNTVKDSVPDSLKPVIESGLDKLETKATDFVEEQIKELDGDTKKAGDAVAGANDKPHGIVP